MDVNFGMVGAGLAVGLLVGLTGMGAGSLMTPILIGVFGIPAGTAVGSDLVYAAITKTSGPPPARRVVGTDLFHAMMVTVAAGLATLVWGTPDFGVVGSILIGSIPGILIGSHFTAQAPERLLRGVISLVLAASGLKLLDAPPVAYAAGASLIAVVAAFHLAAKRRRQ